MRRLRAALLPTGILLVTLAAFWPVLQGEFNWDDDVNLVANLRYRGFDVHQIGWMFTTTLMGHYMPFTWMSLALNHRLGQVNPWGYHLASLLLHAANAVLVYLVARRLLTAALQPPAATAPPGDVPGDSGRRPSPIALSVGAAAAGLLFAVHPQRVESVAWISDRGTVLCGTFYLLAVLAYLRAVTAAGRHHGMWWGAASLVAFAAALLSKGMAMSLPLTLLILDVYPLRRWRAARLRVLAEKAPYCALAVAGAIVAVVARSQGAEFTGYASYGIAARIGLIGYSLWFYPSKLVWPADLSPLYEVPRQVALLGPRFLTPILAVLVVTGGLIALRARIPGALAAWANCAVVIAPVSGIVHSGVQMAADRYSYLAQLGFVVLAGYGLVRFLELHRQGVVRRGVAMVVGSGALLTIGALVLSSWGQSYVWRDPEALWRWAVHIDPLCARCHNNLGVALLHRQPDQQGLSESEDHLRQAVALRPEYTQAHLNLGTVSLIRKRYLEAEVTLSNYVRLEPNARDGAERLAVLYLVQGRSDEAIPLLRRARGMTSPVGARTDLAAAVRLLNDSETLRYLGQALLEQGRPADAVVPLRRAVELRPSVPILRSWLAHAYRGAGLVALADAELAVLRQLDPQGAAPPAVR